MGNGDNSDCAGGFKPCPPNQSKHTWDTDFNPLSLQRDRTKLICHKVVVLLFLKSNLNFLIMGDKSAQQPNNPGEKHLSFEQMVKLCCYYTTNMIPKLIFMLENS
jgi:hypothetical protein